MKKLIVLLMFLMPVNAFAAKVVANVNGTPITDFDLTQRARLMRLQNQPETNIMTRALQNIIDDMMKQEYAAQFKITASNDEIKQAIKDIERQMRVSEGYILENAPSAKDQLYLAAGSGLVWQKTVMQVYGPTVSVSKEDIDKEFKVIEKEYGLPATLKIINEGSCEDEGIRVAETDLHPDIRAALRGLPLKTWSKEVGGQKFMVCEKKMNNKELDMAKTFAENQAIFKRALFDADQAMKTMKRKAVINITDDRYKKALD